MASLNNDQRPIVVKKIKKVSGGGHHGGAWKVAYADFVTAMMAFFLLLWLLNVTTDDQRAAIAAYFDPANPRVSDSTSGSGGVMGGRTMSTEGAMISDKVPPAGIAPEAIPSNMPQDLTNFGKEGENQDIDEAAARAAFEKMEAEAFEEARTQLRQAIKESPDLASLSENLLVDQTPEGLRIQIVDKEGVSMFARGSADMYPRTRQLLELVTEAISGLPNQISIRGHTDSTKYPEGAAYTNWELSSDRANASRRALLDSGLPQSRIANVVGRADKEHLVPDDPESARNRRISIVLLKEEFSHFKQRMEEKAAAEAAKEATPPEETERDGPVPNRENPDIKSPPDKYEFEYIEDEIPLE